MGIPLGEVRCAQDARCRFRRAANLTTLARLALPVLALVMAAADAAASTVRPLNLEEMTGRAAQIFVGRCTAVESVTDEVLGVPVTVATFEVGAVLKGAAGRTVTIRRLPAADAVSGGPAGIAGLPAACPGEEVLLFLYGATASRLTAPVGLGQGQFAIVADKTGRRLAVNAFGNRHLFRGMAVSTRQRLGLSPADADDPGPLPLERLAEMVRTLVAAPAETPAPAPGEGR
jgi:hypothetical protein